MGRKVLLSCPKNYGDCSSDKLGLKDKTTTAVYHTPITLNLIHLGQQEPCDSLAKGQWLLAAACMEMPVVEERWQHQEHCLLPVSLSRLAFCILLLLSVPVPPSPSSLPALGSLVAWRAAALTLPGRRRPCREVADHPCGGHCLPSPSPAPHTATLPPSSAAENELGWWQPVSETLQRLPEMAPC